MSEEKKNEPEEIRVTDRRSLTQTGERRSDAHPSPEPVRNRMETPSRPPPGESVAEQPPLDFETFAEFLGQTALLQLAGTQDPATGKAMVNLQEARQTIDILDMLKQKTHGNLTSQESTTLDRLLYQLKLEYARRAPATRS